MTYKIKDGEKQINLIASSESFVSEYCEKHGYTFELVERPGLPPEPIPDPTPTEAERTRADIDYLAAMLGVDL